MATWAIEEQTIPLTGVEGTLTSMGLRINHPDTSLMIMDLHAGADTYELQFQRNGAFVGWRKIEIVPVAMPPVPPAEEEEPHTKSRAKR